jgi:hypothetical protein
MVTEVSGGSLSEHRLFASIFAKMGALIVTYDTTAYEYNRF